MSADGAKPESSETVAVRPWVKACGMLLITAALLPLVCVVVVGGFLWYHGRHSRTAAEESRARVLVGSTLGDAILASESAAASLACFQASCVTPHDRLLAFRTGSALRVHDGRVLATVDHRQQWRDRLLALDSMGCESAVLTFCGRPWMTFSVDLDGAGRVSRVAELHITGD